MQVLKNVLETRSETRSFHGRVRESVSERERESTRELQHITKRRESKRYRQQKAWQKLKSAGAEIEHASKLKSQEKARERINSKPLE